jgi:membrane-associated phospholipid phosphatase
VRAPGRGSLTADAADGICVKSAASLLAVSITADLLVGHRIVTLRVWLIALTDFGDAAVLIPLAAAMLVWLWAGDSRSSAWWAVSVGFCVGLTALLKIFFHGCPPAPYMHSPSGHTAFSVLVYGALVLAISMQSGSLRRLLAIGIGAGLILTIAASRLLLDIHSPAEIGLGLAIGAASLVIFGRKLGRYHQAKVWPLLATAAVLIAILHGQELHAEQFLHKITGDLKIHCS